MNRLISTNAFDRVTDPVFELFSRDQALRLADFHADETLQHRMEDLASRANEGELTDDERAEYEGYAHANKFVAILKAKVRRRLQSDMQ